MCWYGFWQSQIRSNDYSYGLLTIKLNIMAKYSKGAQKKVESAMTRMEKGKLRSGKSGKKVTNPKQAIAIGLSEARKKGAKVPAPKKKAAKKTATKKKAAPRKKASAKKVATKKSPVKKTAKASIPVKRKARSAKKTMVEEKKIPQTPATVGNDSPTNENDKRQPVIKPEDPIRAFDQKAFNKFTSKGDSRQHLQYGNKSKGGVKPSGKKPLWN